MGEHDRSYPVLRIRFEPKAYFTILTGHIKALEFKAMNVERQCRIFVEFWSDSILIALWRNNVFLHSFRDFSKNNAFSANLMRTESILQKIFFRIGIPSSSKTSWMFFNLH